MILHDVSIYGTDGTRHIHIEGGRIKTVVANRQALGGIADTRVELDGVIALPGLINAHDHLDFNLFPQLGNRIYNNYTEWGKDIHSQNADVINQVLKIPLHLRVRWGLYKNLLNGFTTVMNHGVALKIKDDLVDVFQDCYSLHSPAFEKNWIGKLNGLARKRIPFVMHIGEGADRAADEEISKVARFNFFKRKIIAVHGVAMTTRQATSFAGLVWCPASNFFLLNKTAPVDQLEHATKIAFGTDSTLTANWNAWEHFRLALRTGMVKEEQLVRMLTMVPAGLLKLEDRGMIGENRRADIVVMKKTKDLFSLNPEDIGMVIRGGKLKLLDETLEQQCCWPDDEPFGRIRINGAVKLVAGDINGLIKEVKQYDNRVNFPVTGY